MANDEFDFLMLDPGEHSKCNGRSKNNKKTKMAFFS